MKANERERGVVMCRLYIWDARVYMCEEERRAAQVEDLQCREDDPDPRSAALHLSRNRPTASRPLQWRGKTTGAPIARNPVKGKCIAITDTLSIERDAGILVRVYRNR